jgi:Tol biopolymer transport system component
MLIRLDLGGEFPANSQSGVYLITPGVSGRKQLAGAGFDVLPRWSHDRRRIAFTRRTGGTRWQAWTMDADGGNAALAIGRISPGTVAWSSDDRQLAYVDAVGGVPQLFTITPGQTNATQLTHSPEAKDDPAWHDNRIAFWSARNGSPQIFVLRVDQPDAPWTQVTTSNASCADPAWSPDGTRIAYTHTADGHNEIWVVNADGTGGHAATSAAAGANGDMDPTWSPDGGWIAFTRGSINSPAIYAVRPDGTDLRRITADDSREGHACWS